MKTNFSYSIYLKKPKNYENGPVPVYMRITVDGKRSEVTTNRECEPSEWSVGAGRAKWTRERVWSFNAYLDNLQTKVYDACEVLQQKALKMCFWVKWRSPECFLRYLQSIIER